MSEFPDLPTFKELGHAELVGTTWFALSGPLGIPKDIVNKINRAVQIYAGYMAARNLALAFMLVALLVVGARRSLGNLMVLVGLIQLLDACMDVYEGRWVVVPGVLIFGLIFLIGATRLSDGNPFWKLRAWIH